MFERCSWDPGWNQFTKILPQSRVICHFAQHISQMGLVNKVIEIVKQQKILFYAKTYRTAFVTLRTIWVTLSWIIWAKHLIADSKSAKSKVASLFSRPLSRFSLNKQYRWAKALLTPLLVDVPTWNLHFYIGLNWSA